jgi:two-component sensor histidine kinase
VEKCGLFSASNRLGGLVNEHLVNKHLVAEVMRLEPTLAAPLLARRRVRDLFADLPDAQQAVAVLLTHELVTNAVQHPQRRRGDEEIEVRLSRTEQLLRVEVVDDDPGPLPPPRRRSEPSEHGMGLVLVDDLATRWGSETTDDGGGKVVWFELLLPAAPGGK